MDVRENISRVEKMKDTSLEEKIKSGTAIVGVIGMGCIGLSLLDVFAKAGFSLRGFDKDSNRVATLSRSENPFHNFPIPDFFKAIGKDKVKLGDTDEVLHDADVLIISVPTSLDEHNIPDLGCLRKAFGTVSKHLHDQQLIVLQSSTYPGCTEGELLPLLEESKLKVGKNFYLGHVPEIADIGNPNYAFDQVPRIVSGVTSNCLHLVQLLYKKIKCEVVPCTRPSVAESAKLLQNSYRLINISFINES